MAGTQPLTRGQQLLMQRLMTRHIMTDEQAQESFRELLPDMDGCCETLEECFGQINKQTSRGFGLEIATASLMVTVPNGDGDDDDVSESRLRAHKRKFHAIINQHNDEVAKKSFGFHFNPSERALMRLIFEHLVQNHPVSSPQSRLINLRSDLMAPYKLTLNQARGCVQMMMEEKWLNASQNGGAMIGVRAYLELSHLLTDFGLPEDSLPQFIFHRI